MRNKEKRVGVHERAFASRHVASYRAGDPPPDDSSVDRLLGQIREEPWNPLLHGMLGRLRQQRREYRDAIDAWREGIVCWGTDSGARGSLRELTAETYLLLNDPQAAKREYMAAIDEYSLSLDGTVCLAEDNTMSRLAFCLRRVGKDAEAQQFLRKIARGPNSAVFEEVVAEIDQVPPIGTHPRDEE